MFNSQRTPFPKTLHSRSRTFEALHAFFHPEKKGVVIGIRYPHGPQGIIEGWGLATPEYAARSTQRLRGHIINAPLQKKRNLRRNLEVSWKDSMSLLW
ncbi:hypothetical protein V5799_006290 [Amblyomma americanum]|uniref:Uncharacterized protein n=1 Tax=Amblyomma americanum TaxID=6943 RepID=A0AAQ4DWT1_AMBAM